MLSYIKTLFILFLTSRYCFLSGEFDVHQALPLLNKAYSGFEYLSLEKYWALGAWPEESNGLLQSEKEKNSDR